MPEPVLIGIDQGTGSTRALAIDTRGRQLGLASRPLDSHSPRPGWLEQDAGRMRANVVECLRELLADLAGREVAGVGIANQTETLCVWDAESGQPVMPAIVWGCRRAAPCLPPLAQAARRAGLRARTGLDLDATFTAAKLRWLMRERVDLADGLRRGTLLWGTVDCWLAWSLTGGRTYASDAGNASRTALLDIQRLRWDPELAALFELDLARWPALRPSAADFGYTAAGLLPRVLPLRALMGDQQAALFGQGGFAPGALKLTYGTGAFLWLNSGGQSAAPRAPGLLRSIAWQLEQPCYACEGFIMSAGASLNWLAGRLGLAEGAAGALALAARTGDAGGVTVVPAFQGMAAPWWRPQARGALLGLSEHTGPGEICQAALEALCHQVRALLTLMAAEQPAPRPPLRVDGGLTGSAWLMQLQADIAGQPLQRAGTVESTAWGVALMAGLGAGVWADTGALEAVLPRGRLYTPDPARTAGWSAAHARWMRLTEAVLALD